MRPSPRLTLLIVALLATPFSHNARAAENPKSFFIEAEEFQFPGNCSVEHTGECSGGAALKTISRDSSALTAILLPESGTYNLWVRTKDYATDHPKSRRFQLLVDGAPAGREAGIHGLNGWWWEKVGEQELQKGDHVIGIQDTNHGCGRCDAILLTTGTDDPNKRSIKELQSYHLEPMKITANAANSFLDGPRLKQGARRELAHIGNNLVRVGFFEAADEQGNAVVIRRTEVFQDNAWVDVPIEQDQETLFLIYSPGSKINTASFFPFWNQGAKVAFEVGGKRYETTDGKNPFTNGAAEVLIPRTCTVKDPSTAEIRFVSASGREVTGLWQIKSERRDVAFSVRFIADKAGQYSIGFSPFQAWPKENTEFNLLPPVYNFQRLPDHPLMSVNGTMPHALALTQATPAGTKQTFSFAVVADPDRISFDWPDSHNSVYGFSLLNSAEKVQPTIFSPVLGLPDSLLKAGETKTVSWSVLVQPGDWKQALEYASEKVFKVTDYRHPYGASLTDAVFNMIDLIKDQEHSGWDPKLKGFYNIESDATASESSPLILMSAALLTHDEDFYVKRALPALEFTLSRPGAHFATKVPSSIPAYINAEGTKIHVPSNFYGTAYWQGAYDLLGRKNPWLADFAFNNGGIRSPSLYSTIPKWSDMMGAYRLHPKPELLAKIKAECDQFLKTQVYGRHTEDIGIDPFYNVSFYPYWWDLIDLYELTADTKYVQAAEECAFHTIAGQWSQAGAAASGYTTNPGGKLPYENFHKWWKNDQREYRLGWPLTPAKTPEKEVPAWVVSRVGLGFEQPCTYHTGGEGTFRNILMSAWAPNLLRVYEYTGRDIFQTYARNSVIGRFSNYPGYYIRFYSDQQLAPRYPLEGPDITDIYYHHIPPHLAFTVDFLVTEAAVRSHGQIVFPWVKQQGYVWFTNRIYGHAPGKVYEDEKAWLWLDREAVNVKSEQISTLSTRSTNRFNLILMNESDEAIAPAITLDTAKLGILPEQPYRVYTNGKPSLQQGPVSQRITVPAKGLAVVSFPARAPQGVTDIPILNTAPVQQKLGGNWGTLHAFRIRSPFAKDSLYVVLTGHPASGGTVHLTLDGQSGPGEETKSYPYEFTVYPWPMDRDMTFQVTAKDDAGIEIQSKPITLKGTPH